MTSWFQNFRPRERAIVIAGMAVLVGLMSSHLLMETARDAVFLADIPAERLPFVYLLIAILSLGVSTLQRKVETWLGASVALMSWLGTAAAVTVVLWAILDNTGDFGRYLLYVLPAVVSSVTLIQFWTMVGDALTAGTAKRLYVWLGAGGGIGAIAGSGIAAGLSAFVPAAHLLLVAAGIWALTPIAVRRLGRAISDVDLEKGGAEDRDEQVSRWRGITQIFGDRYAWRVAALAIALPVISTLGDYLFKSLASEYVDASSLGTFFGSVYFVLNIVSVALQLSVVRSAVQQTGIAITLAILPGLMLVGGGLVAAGFAFSASVGLKVADGALRHSLYETAEELLYVPLSDDLRNRLKTFSSTIGKRGGQAVASLGLLGLIGFGVSVQLVGAALAAAAGFAVAVAVGVRGPYLDLFRSRFDPRRIEHLVEYPDLDVDSLEVLLSRLNSHDDAEVIAAIDLLEHEGRTRTIPALLLYHPSDRVVLRGLAAFVRDEVEEILPVVNRLEHNADPPMHAVLLSVLSSMQPDRGWLEEHLDHPEAIVRTASEIHLVANGWYDIEDFEFGSLSEENAERLDEKRALAFTIGLAGSADFLPELADYLNDERLEIRLATVRAMTNIESERSCEILRDRLWDRELQDAIIDAFDEFGAAGFEFLAESLHDDSLPRRIRWRLPEAISHVRTEDAAELLAEQLPNEDDGVVRVRIVEALERLRLRRDDLEVPSAPLRETLRTHIRRAFEHLDWRRQLAEHADEQLEARTSYTLLEEMLDDKREHALDLALRLVGLLYPNRDVQRARRGIHSDDPVRRASAHQLLETVLPVRLSTPLLALVEFDSTPARRLGQSGDFYEPNPQGEVELLETFLGTKSDGLALLVAAYASDSQLRELAGPLREATDWADDDVREQLRRTADELTGKENAGGGTGADRD